MRVHCKKCGWYSENKTTPQGYALAKSNHQQKHTNERLSKRQHLSIVRDK